MKKLIYIFSIAIGLLLTGCEKWEVSEPMAPDTWGPVAELTVITPDTLITDVLDLEIQTKYASHVSFTVTGSPIANVNYTTLLQGSYGGMQYEPETEADTTKVSLPGVEAGNTYYVYAVAANQAGVQTTFYKAIGAIDVTAPYITSAPQLQASDKGRRVAIAFSENILRDAEMGAIEYTVYALDVETGAATLFKQGTDATAVATGATLTVTLPVEFDKDTYYMAMLSFAEGAVTDIYGNKMAAVTSTFDESALEVTNGYWWLVEPAPDVDPDAFFNEGTYNFYVVFTQEGNQYEADLAFNMEFVGDGFDLSTIFGPDVAGMTAKEWSLSGLLSSLYGSEMATDKAFPALTYTYQASAGVEVQDITIIDYNDQDFMTSVGSLTASGASYPAYIAFYQGQSIGGYYWDFILADTNGDPSAPVENLIGWWGIDGYTPAIFVYGDLGQGEGLYLLMEFDQIYLTREGMVQAQGAKRYDKPVKMENMQFNPVQKDFEHKVLLKK